MPVLRVKPFVVAQVIAYQNQLTQLPDLSAATALTVLNVSQNRLTHLPSLSTLRGLQELNVSSNAVASLPAQGWESLVVLRSFQCSKNKLSTIPNGIARLPQLVDIDLVRLCFATGTIVLWMCVVMALWTEGGHREGGVSSSCSSGRLVKTMYCVVFTCRIPNMCCGTIIFEEHILQIVCVICLQCCCGVFCR